MQYSPIFTAIAINNQDPTTAGLRKIGMLEIVGQALGIKFPRIVNPQLIYTDLKVLKDSLYVRNRPIVIFPEGTKTNGRGIL